jgi:hypothetical protein
MKIFGFDPVNSAKTICIWKPEDFFQKKQHEPSFFHAAHIYCGRAFFQKKYYNDFR